jgi:hypothetical protein
MAETPKPEKLAIPEKASPIRKNWGSETEEARIIEEMFSLRSAAKAICVRLAQLLEVYSADAKSSLR